MDTKIIQIGDLLAEDDVDKIDYYSNHYFLDADIIIIDISAIIYEFEKLFETKVIDNRPIKILSANEYLSWIKRIVERGTELTKFLENAGNLFVLNAPLARFEFNMLSVDNTVTKEEIDFLAVVLLSSDSFDFKSVKGSNISFVKPFDAFSQLNYCYNYVYVKHAGYPIFRLTKTNEVAGVCVHHEKGNIILLPNVTIGGDDYEEFQYLSSKFKIVLEILDFELKTANSTEVIKTQTPVWASQFLIGNEVTENRQLEVYLGRKLEIEQLIHQQEQKLTQYQELKSLLWESGNQLETVVAKIFTDIGYEVTMPSGNRDDLIAKKDESVIVMEIKGVKNSAAEKNAAQLSKWVTNYHIENDINPKGILVVNAFKDKPLSERNEPAFPHQMLKYCTQREYLLITTVQLLALYLDFREGKVSFDDLHNLLFSSIGTFEYDTSNQIKRLLTN